MVKKLLVDWVSKQAASDAENKERIRPDDQPRGDLHNILIKLNEAARKLHESSEQLEKLIDGKIDSRLSKIENKIWRSLFAALVAIGGFLVTALIRGWIKIPALSD